MSTITFNEEFTKFDDILLRIRKSEERLLNSGYNCEELCLFMSKDIIDCLVNIFNKYVVEPEIKDPKSSFMCHPIRFTKGKNKIYFGIPI